ncbi:hypothetical protein E3G43_001645 [Mycobacteroides abscessus]|nr:hypothetical protein E3G43_001645 [Mycobacteroides abscessus]
MCRCFSVPSPWPARLPHRPVAIRQLSDLESPLARAVGNWRAPDSATRSSWTYGIRRSAGLRLQRPLSTRAYPICCRSSGMTSASRAKNASITKAEMPALGRIAEHDVCLSAYESLLRDRCLAVLVVASPSSARQRGDGTAFSLTANTSAHIRVTGDRSYAIIGSIADRGTSTCSAPYESGNIAPWSKKNRIPSLSTAKFW